MTASGGTLQYCPQTIPHNAMEYCKVPVLSCTRVSTLNAKSYGLTFRTIGSCGYRLIPDTCVPGIRVIWIWSASEEAGLVNAAERSATGPGDELSSDDIHVDACCEAEGKCAGSGNVTGGGVKTGVSCTGEMLCGDGEGWDILSACEAAESTL